MRLVDLSGQQFGKLTAIERVPTPKHTVWRCRCACGGEALVEYGNLTSGRQKACGCGKHRPSPNRTHGETGSRLHRIYHAMRRRCNNPNNHVYKYYGGRGIVVCDEWSSFIPFRDWAMANGYADDLTIDRKDNDGRYEPSNCEWVSMIENIKRRHRRTSP